MDISEILNNFNFIKNKQLVMYKNLDFNIVLTFIIAEKNNKLYIKKTVNFYSNEIEYEISSNQNTLEKDNIKDSIEKLIKENSLYKFLKDIDFIFEVSNDNESTEIYINKLQYNHNNVVEPITSNNQLKKILKKSNIDISNKFF